MGEIDKSLLFPYGENAEDIAIAAEMEAAAGKICLGRVRCSHCGKIYGTCAEIEYNLTTGANMTIPTSSGGSTQGGQSRGKQQGLQYARWDSPWLSFDKKEARVIDVKVNIPVEGKQQFSDVVMKFACDGVPRLWGFKAGTPELEKLTAAWGSNENDWPEKKFFIYLEEDMFDGKRYVRAEPIMAEKKKGK
jgi:hypothetical protein